MSQGSRDGVMIAFKDNRVPVLVATDIAARGLDVQNVTHVINYDLPNSAEIYTHRIGRTGRAGRGGRAITLVESRDKDDFRAIEKHINVEVPEWDAANAGKPAAVPARKDESAGAAQSTADGERAPRQRRPRSRGGDAAEQIEAAAAAEAAVDAAVEPVDNESPVPDEAGEETAAIETPPEPPTGDHPIVETGIVAEDVVAEDVVAEEPSAEAEAEAEAEAPSDEADAADETELEASAGVIPDRSADEPKPAPFTWGPSPTKAEEEPETEEPAAPEASEPEADAPEAEADAQDEEVSSEEPAADAGERELRRPRHVKPNQEELDGDFSLLIVGGGSSRGVEPADVIELVTAKSNLTGNDIRRVRVLSRYTLMQVPSDKAADVAGAIDGAELRGQSVTADAVVADAS
jgi:superfamily II DNA/RNA helicase